MVVMVRDPRQSKTQITRSGRPVYCAASSGRCSVHALMELKRHSDDAGEIEVVARANCPPDGGLGLEPSDDSALATVIEAPQESHLSSDIRAIIRHKHPIHRWLTRRIHATSSWIRRPGLAGRALSSAWSVGLLAYPLFKIGWRHGLAYTSLWILTGLYKAYKDAHPSHLPLLQQSYLTRELRLHKVLSRALARGSFRMSVQEQRELQVEILELVAAYVREHRNDLSSTQIFASLLVEDKDELVVVARDRAGRQVPARRPREGMLAAQVFQTGVDCCTGDVSVDFPDTPADKSYRSILAIPVKDANHKVRAVVSIDSSLAYHFDDDRRELVTYLYPYVSLMLCTLAPGCATAPGGAGKTRERKR